MPTLLTPEQVEELERGGGSLLVEDPRSHRGYVLVPTEAYERARFLFDAIIQSTHPTPAAQANSTSLWTHAKNARRCALIDKKYDQGLDANETQELSNLQSELASHQRFLSPRPLRILELIEEGLKHRASLSSPPQ